MGEVVSATPDSMPTPSPWDGLISLLFGVVYFYLTCIYIGLVIMLQGFFGVLVIFEAHETELSRFCSLSADLSVSHFKLAVVGEVSEHLLFSEVLGQVLHDKP